ncbi:hypothetical protein Taro_001212, partial [Colocasia esculenta]|nr:hypothetical protein [Colocasia esculenta]
MGRKRSVEYVEPNEGEDDKSQNVAKTSNPSSPIASADILKAKKKDFSECYGDIYTTKNKTVIADAMSSIDIAVPSTKLQDVKITQPSSSSSSSTVTADDIYSQVFGKYRPG